ncbi:hypothetical protein FIV42_17745 [Persicimonas caeni]|uniref:Uncharacterized protein n=1 Tax=Persicimonas caeni TaxID=2292766 RepID=A0A4Y6PWK1_PERCE|nr:hypothetical protein [Persicimonas caeni]QDG52509.1 hypothetical protein FIV42_17745 [Persicimonas caeni]QED33731.1 hypothetical protein FRD00_17740 [Persicimonas caeni]
MKRLKHLAVLIVTLLLVATSFGCERKPADLEEWRTAKGGMEKMQEWAQSGEEPRPVRVRAFEILVEEGEGNALPPTLEGVEDEKLRAEMVEAAVPIVVSKWEKQDMPKLSGDVKEKGGRIAAGASESVEAKDAAYFLHPFAKGESQKKLESIIGEWMSTDWQLRNQLGSTTLGQIAPRAGESGTESLIKWLEEAVQPSTVVTMINKHGDDKTKQAAAKVLRKRAEEEHPELGKSLQIALLSLEHEELSPYFKKAITDPNSPNELVDASMDALVRIEGEKAAPFFSDLVKNRSGLLRWVSATRLVEVMGKPAFTYVAAGLPVEMDSYPTADSKDLVENTQYFCKMYHGEMKDEKVESVSDQLTRGLNSSRWPARMLALQCARIFKADDLKDQISALTSDRQGLPGWGEKKTVGDLASEVLEELSKS